MHYVTVIGPEQAMKGAYIQQDYKYLTFKCNYIRTEGIRNDWGMIFVFRCILHLILTQ